MIRELKIIKKNKGFYLTWLNDKVYPLTTLSSMLMSNGVATFVDRRFGYERSIIIALSEVSDLVIGEEVK